MSHAPSFYKAPRYLFRKQNVLDMLSSQPDIKIFSDIGCGAGELACTLAEKGYRGSGIDFADEALEVANGLKKKRSISDKNLKFKKGGLENVLGKKDEVVICCEVIEHIEGDIPFLKELQKKKPGYAIFSVPARQKWFDQFDEKVGHYRRYEKVDLMKLLNDNGYEVLDFRSYGYPYINLTRLIRKMLARKVKEQSNIEKRTKESGINPIKLKGVLSKIDIEPLVKILNVTSKPFNRFNLSEGYVVLCRIKN